MAAAISGSAWSYSVPLDDTDGTARAYRPPRGAASGHGEAAAEPSKPLEHKSSAWDLQSDTEAAKARKRSMRANNRSRSALRDKLKQEQEPINDYSYSDDSAWIHRDKLAQIEFQEMAEAGIYLRPSRRSQSAGPGRADTSRSVSRSVSRRRTQERAGHVSRAQEECAGDDPSQPESEQTVGRVASAATSPEHGEPARLLPRAEPQSNHAQEEPDYRQSEPVLEQPAPKQISSARPSTSRIPVSRISPVPVPQQVVERDTPAPRSRAGSQSVSGSWDEVQRYAPKARSASVASAQLLDDPEAKRPTPPGSSSDKASSTDESSPKKARSPKKTLPTARKGSVTGSTIPQPRAVTGSATRRPGSSAGRPSMSQYTPEGTPPWAATMYKPDPRLPPDQQMLPTHAKRMMQDKWEKEGKTGTIYDKDFRLLNEEDMRPKNPPPLSLHLDCDANQRLSSTKTLSPKKLCPNGSSVGNGWPLSAGASSDAGRSDTSSVRAETSGGYKITPRIPSTSTTQRSAAPSPVSPQSPVQSGGNNLPPRIPDRDEKEEAAPQKGCCCVIM